MVGWSNVSYILKKKRGCILRLFPLLSISSSTSDPQPSCCSTPLLSLTVALCALLRWWQHWHSITPSFCVFFFLCPFLPPFVRFPILPTPLPPELPPLPPPPPRRAACLEIYTRRSSVPLRTCSWTAKTRASCCSPGVVSASRGTFSSECVERTLPTAHSSRAVLVAYRRLSTNPMGMFHPDVVSAALS